MADLSKKLAGNTPGEFFVDSSCIDCDQCRQIAPDSFRAKGDYSIVHHQPASSEESLRAEMALITCPTASIGTLGKRNLRKAIDSFPERIEDNVSFCGFAAESSFGASSYLIVKPEGNVLVDSPRFTAPLVRNIERLGGVRWLFLTHQDDVADHAKFREKFGCDRVMHEDDAGFTVEREIQGQEPIRLADDLLIIPTPGHTRGHQALLYRQKFLFTGDHLWGSGAGLSASRSVCWYSWVEQTRSMERLLDYSFEWVLPGHGARHHAAPEEMRRKIRELVTGMKR